MEEDSICCTCNVISKCPIGAGCQCQKYCFHYINLYNEIIDGGKYCWLTISPKPLQIETDEEKMAFWLCEFARVFRYCSNRYLIVIEYTNKMILHFHIMVKIYDYIRFKRQGIQTWYYKANIEPIYGSQPAKGVHYLFKSIDDVASIIGFTPIFTQDNLNSHNKIHSDLKNEFYGLSESDSDH